MLVQQIEDEGDASERPSDSQPIPSPPHPKGSGGNHRDMDDTLDYMETKDDQNKGRTSSVVLEKKESADKEVSIEASISTRQDKRKARTKNTKNKEKLKEKEKGVEIRNIEDTERPRPTSTRSILTLRPLPKIDPKDKGKKRIEEENESDTESKGITKAEKKIKQLANDEESQESCHRSEEAEEKERAFNYLMEEDLKIMMESSTKENDQGDFWNNQQEWEIVRWRLYEACGVCILELKDGTVIYMLVERRYLLSKELLQQMINLGLEMTYYNMMHHHYNPYDWANPSRQERYSFIDKILFDEAPRMHDRPIYLVDRVLLFYQGRVYQSSPEDWQSYKRGIRGILFVQSLPEEYSPYIIRFMETCREATLMELYEVICKDKDKENNERTEGFLYEPVTKNRKYLSQIRFCTCQTSILPDQMVNGMATGRVWGGAAIPIPKPDYQSYPQTRPDPHRGSNWGAPLGLNASPKLASILIRDLIKLSFLCATLDQSRVT
ncbi:hypothetical protein Tco_0664237 [Tanacetum coccineum]